MVWSRFRNIAIFLSNKKMVGQPTRQPKWPARYVLQKSTRTVHSYVHKITCMPNFCWKKCAERRSCCDVTDQQASPDSCEAADSCHARLRQQFHAANAYLEHFRDNYLDFVSRVHQPRRQLLHLPGGEHRIQEPDKNHDKRHIQESATWNRAENICAALVHVHVWRGGIWICLSDWLPLSLSGFFFYRRQQSFEIHVMV